MFQFRQATRSDTAGLLQLHRTVARISQGIARTETEITEAYIQQLFLQTTQNGLMLVALSETGQLIAEIHASKYGLRIFDHILTGLTIVVHPDFQGMGIGKKLFQQFLQDVQQQFPEVGRVELESRATNHRSISLYQRLGFELEGRMKHKTRNLDGSFEDSLLMAWTKPGFH